MASTPVPVMVFCPDEIDYSLIGTEFTIIQTYASGGNASPEFVLAAAKQKLEELFGGTAEYDVSTGKVSLTVSGVDRERAEAYLEALKSLIDYMKT